MAERVYDEEVVHMSSRGKGTWGIVLAVVLLLGGCGAKNEPADSEMTSKEAAKSTMDYEFLEEQDLVWKDNSLDELQAVFSLPIEDIKTDGELIWGGLTPFADENGAVRLKPHPYSDMKRSWSGVNGVTVSGELFSGKVIVDPELSGIQIDFLGPVAGDNTYIACRYDEHEDNEMWNLHFFILNDKFEKLKEIQGKETFDIFFNTIACDKDGNIHLMNNGDQYLVLSPEGEKIFETKLFSSSHLCVLDDGRVVVVENDIDDRRALSGWKIFEANLENGATHNLAKISIARINVQQCPAYVTMSSIDEAVVCDSDGIYRYNLQDDKRRTVYKWSKHGLSLQDIISVYAKSDGTIGVVYKDKEGMQYILLKPMFEEREIKNIEFAVSPKHVDTYRDAVAAFNRKYPTYAIEMVENYEETPLLTKLGAGDGPVLIDTEITGFEPLEKLWQPLDGYLEKTGLLEELYPQALAFGQIGNTTYGIVPTFSITTMVAKDNSLVGWDYDSFLDAVEKFDGAAFAYPYIFEPTNHRGIFFEVLINGLYDNAYLNLEKGTVVFGTPAFKRILTLAEKANPCLPVEDGKTLQENKALCEMVFLKGVRDIMYLRMRLECGDVVNVGYPTINGGKTMLVADSPIAIRSTATDEEKQIAYTFFKIMLSHESAMVLATDNSILYSGHFSVRKEILEEQFTRHNLIHEYNDDPEIDKEKECALFEELLENSAIKKTFPADLQNVFDEEFYEYLNGEIPADLLDSRLKSRIGLYLDER